MDKWFNPDSLKEEYSKETYYCVDIIFKDKSAQKIKCSEAEFTLETLQLSYYDKKLHVTTQINLSQIDSVTIAHITEEVNTYRNFEMKERRAN